MPGAGAFRSGGDEHRLCAGRGRDLGHPVVFRFEREIIAPGHSCRHVGSPAGQPLSIRGPGVLQHPREGRGAVWQIPGLCGLHPGGAGAAHPAGSGAVFRQRQYADALRLFPGQEIPGAKNGDHLCGPRLRLYFLRPGDPVPGVYRPAHWGKRCHCGRTASAAPSPGAGHLRLSPVAPGPARIPGKKVWLHPGHRLRRPAGDWEQALSVAAGRDGRAGGSRSGLCPVHRRGWGVL